MNREIKFRVWDNKRKQFAEGYEIEESYDELYSDAPGLFFGGLGALKRDNRYIIQQFTGLKDSHNKEIYEGDIIETCIADGDKNERFSVVFVDGCFCRHDYNCNFVNTLLIDNLGIGQADKVIGNIFENPRLLK
jgi:uncharacterized phage protein (TIGR01671 family)